MKLHEAARNYLGTPFLHRGRGSQGMDCGGLLLASLRDIGLIARDLGLYNPTLRNGILQDALERCEFFTRVRTNAPQVDDVLLFRFHNEPQHLAICCGGTMIHATSKNNAVVEHRLSGSWLRSLVCTYRLKQYG